MASKNDTAPTAVMFDETDGWEVAFVPRSTIIFDEIGDSWTGIYEGPGKVANEKTGEEYDYFFFGGVGEQKGQEFQISQAWSLRQGLKNVPEGHLTRIDLVDLLAMDDSRSDAKMFRVLHKPVK
jgi:hypothetical protein